MIERGMRLSLLAGCAAAMLSLVSAAFAEEAVGEAPQAAPAAESAPAGVSDVQSGEQAPAEKTEEKAVDPQSFYHYALGREHFGAGRIDEAIAEYKKAADLDPRSAVILRDLAAAYLAKRDREKAGECYRKAVELDPKDVESLYNLGRLAAGAKDAGALGYFQKVLEVARDPERNRFYGLSLYQAATLLDEQGKGREAADALGRLVKWLVEAPGLVAEERELSWLMTLRQTLVAKAVQLYLREKQPALAVKLVRESSPDLLGEPGFGAWLAMSLLEDGQGDLALEVAREMQRRRPNDAASYRLLARVYDERKDTEGFIKAFRELAKEHPDLRLIDLLLGQKLLTSGHEEEGLKLVEKVIENEAALTEAGSQSLLPSVVSSLLDGGKADVALRVALAMQKHWPKDPESYWLLERIYDLKGDAEGFVKAFRQFHEVHPDVKVVGLLLGKKLLATGAAEEGLKFLEPLLGKGSGVADLAREVLVAHYGKIGEAVKALRLYAEAISEDPKDAAAIFRLAQFVDGLENKPAVMESVRAALEKMGKEVGANFVLGMLAESFDAAVAADYFEAAVEADPKFTLGYERRSAMLIQLDRLMEALDTLRQAIGNGLRLGAFFRRMGVIYELVDRDADAIATYRTATRVDPEDRSSLYRIPKVLVRIGQADKAREMLEEAIAGDPKQSRPYIEMAILSDELQEPGVALAAIDRGLRELPENPELTYFRASLLRQAKDYDGAMKLCEKLASVEGFGRGAEALRVGILMSRKQFDRAEEFVLKLKEREPDEPEHDHLLSAVYSEKGDTAKAEQVLAEILKKHPRNSAANNDLGYMQADRGERLAESERMIRIALQENPESSAYLDSLGWVLYKQNRMEESLVYLRRSVRLDPRIDPVVWDHLGDALARLGRRDEAREAYEKAEEMLKNPNRTASREDEEVQKRLRGKLDAIRKSKEVPTAPLGKGVK